MNSLYKYYMILWTICFITIAFGGANYKVLKIEKCMSDGKRIIIEKFDIIDGFLASFKINVTVELDFIFVST